MSALRRRIIRPNSVSDSLGRRLTRLRGHLQKEERLLANWLVRMKRAFHGFEKHQLRVNRMQREIRELETVNVTAN